MKKFKVIWLHWRALGITEVVQHCDPDWKTYSYEMDWHESHGPQKMNPTDFSSHSSSEISLKWIESKTCTDIYGSWTMKSYFFGDFFL